MEQLIAELARFPGVGRRSAERMAFDLLSSSHQRVVALHDAIGAVEKSVGVCAQCGYFAVDGDCLICAQGRDCECLLVVERALDVTAIERAGGYRGLYHVLGGHLSPLKGIGPSALRIEELFERVRTEPVRELILATSPSVEGDATALYISRHVDGEKLRVTRLGRGVPMGASLEFSDAGTLRMALEGRRGMDSP
ncbi:recombination protein RecR [Candidatus Sumerlaeota bacterium]|nr:recombination protein RecR [Candidatus Sumerlaeota bacterium]